MKKSQQNKPEIGQHYRRPDAQTHYRTAAPPPFRCTTSQLPTNPATNNPKTHRTNAPMTHLPITEPRNTKFTERTHRRFSQPVSRLVRSDRKPIIPPQTIPPTHLIPTNPRQKFPNSDPFRTGPPTLP